MSGRGRSFVFAYAFLVVLPLFGLAGVLRNGRHLSAPPAIDGLWRFQIDAGEGNGCGIFLASIPDKLISISQSGKSFILSVPSEPAIAAAGTIEGNTLRASLTSRKSSSQNSCSGATEFNLVAKVDGQANSSLITGVLSDANCVSCAAVPFKAERQKDATSKAGR